MSSDIRHTLQSLIIINVRCLLHHFTISSRQIFQSISNRELFYQHPHQQDMLLHQHPYQQYMALPTSSITISAEASYFINSHIISIQQLATFSTPISASDGYSISIHTSSRWLLHQHPYQTIISRQQLHQYPYQQQIATLTIMIPTIYQILEHNATLISAKDSNTHIHTRQHNYRRTNPESCSETRSQFFPLVIF